VTVLATLASCAREHEAGGGDQCEAGLGSRVWWQILYDRVPASPIPRSVGVRRIINTVLLPNRSISWSAGSVDPTRPNRQVGKTEAVTGLRLLAETPVPLLAPSCRSAGHTYERASARRATTAAHSNTLSQMT